MDKVREAAFSMMSRKSSGLDGAPPGFFEIFWGDIAHQVRDMVNAFFVGEIC